MFQLRWLWQNMKGNRAAYILALFLSIVCHAMFLINPLIGQQIVDTFIKNENALTNLQEQRGLLIGLCLGMVGFTVVRTVIQYITNTLYEVTSQGMIYRLRIFLYNKIQNQDMQYYDQNSTGDLMTRLTGDLDMVRHTASWIIKTMLESLALFLAAVVFFFSMDWLLTLAILALTPVIFIITRLFAKKVGPRYVDLRERLSQLNTCAQENIAGNRVVKAFAREEFEIDKFNGKNQEYSKANKETAMVWLGYFPFMEIFAQALTVVLFLVGGLFIMNGRITYGEYAAFSALIWTISNPMRNLGILINDMQKFFASASKIMEIYYSSPSIENNHDLFEEKRYEGHIEFKDVSFKFGNSKVLKHINFTIEPGETIAIMGATGAGKSTLINLIPRFYDVYSGEVKIDGKDVRDLPIGQLRSNIGMATQEVLLFSETIDGNIAYGDSDMPEEDVKEYARLASASDFIEKMPENYNTIVGERGVGLSGGQKQRIALARAMAIRPPILILDDTTSAVDMETEVFIQNSLRNLDYTCTKIIIAQRISTTKAADKIIIIDNGKIIEMGSHKELLKQKGYYHDIYTLQNEGLEKAGVQNG